MSSVKLIVPESNRPKPLRRISTSASGRNIMLMPKGMPQQKKIAESPTFSELPSHVGTQRRNTLFGSSSMNLPEQKYEIDVHLLSNYGHPDKICLSKIEVLTKDRIPVRQLAVVPEDMKYDSPKIERLTSSSLLKNTMDEMWVDDFSANGGPVIFHLHVQCFLAPEFVRLFNSKIGETMCTKEFSVYIQGKFIQTAIIPNDFGTTISLRQADFQTITPIENFLVLPKVPTYVRSKDDFGNLPILKTNSITFKLYSSYSGKPRIGLNGIEMFDLNGKKINPDLITNIEVFNGASISSPRYLFKPDKITMNVDDMWIAAIQEPPVSVKLTLCETRMISLIRVWNYNGYNDSQLWGVKNIKVFVNDTVPVFFGRLRRGKGMTTNIEDSITDIWISENFHLKHLPAINNIYSDNKE